MKLPIDMIEPDAPAKTCPPCHGDCDQGDTCPNRLQSTADYGECQLMNVLLVLAFFWLLVSSVLIYFALR